MAKTSFLDLTNRILRRINQSTIADVTAATGHALIITNLINEAQIQLFAEDDWYSMYATRIFKTTVYTASTISFADANPDTINDSANGFGDLEAGSMVFVSGSTSNDGTYEVTTAAAGALTLDSTEQLTVEAAGEEITITAITYSVPSDHGRTISLSDTTNNQVMIEDITRILDENDPNMNETGTSRYFAIEAGFYRFSRIPAGVYTIRERYWKQPTTMTANANTSDLPIELENCIIWWAWYNILEYLNKFDQSDRIRIEYNRMLKKAKDSNQNKINTMNVMGGQRLDLGLARLPHRYGRRVFF